MRTVLVVVLVASFSFIKCQTECNIYKTCGECIGHGSGPEVCVWCSQVTVFVDRCQLKSYSDNNKEWCDSGFIQNPPSVKNTTVNKEFGDTADNVTVQFKPQQMRIKARPGDLINFTMSYKPAKDFPLDVYYLLDNSYTMADHQKALQDQAKIIYEELHNMTNNVQLGIGTFVEKREFPYFDKNKQNVENSPTFRNVLSLTTNMEQFQHKVQNIRFGANFDDMEAGLDALMQVMTCEKEIGWRTGSRRIIVFCTDSPYHSAGDGKMLGITKPNDMACHLKNQIYDWESKQDYPSVGQINKVASDGKFNIIFAALKEVREVYTLLADQIFAAKYAELAANSNIVDIIMEGYKDNIQTSKLNYDKLPAHVQLKIDQNCEGQKKINCASTISQPIVDIPATLKVLECPVGVKSHEFSISPITVTDKLSIKLEVICSCSCEVKGTITPECSNAGYLQCGVCKCLDTSFGDTCQCNSSAMETGKKEEDYSKCKKDANDYPCSNHGTCKCGKCSCEHDYSGNFCEYNDKLCPQSNGRLCAGNGKCTLGACRCNYPWIGESCDCTTDKKPCIAPYSEEECSGNGICECGKCKCSQVEGKNETYTGMFCDACTDCQAKYCKTFENYVKCYYTHENKDNCKTALNDTENIDVQLVNKTEINSLRWREAAWCNTKTEEYSIIIFRYYYQGRKLHIIIQKELESPPIANKWIALASAIAIIVLIGLLTLIMWKILVDLHDKREYEKFEKESSAQGFDVSLNPLYEGPELNFSNPIYNRNM